MSSDENRIAARYVRALFDLASENDQHDAIRKDMLALKAVLAQSEDLRRLLVSPIVTREKAEKAIAMVLEAIKSCDLTRKFFLMLARQRRLAVLPQTIEQYLAQLAESRDELTVYVTSATPMNDAQLKTLAQALAQSTGKKVEIKADENANLIGGLQVRIGSRMFDNSIAAKLVRLRLALTKAA